MTLAELLVHLGQLVLVSVIVFILLCALTSYLRFQHMAGRARSSGEADEPDMESYHILVVDLLGSQHREPTVFSLVMVCLHPGAPSSIPADEVRAKLRERLGLSIRSSIRESDFFVRVEEESYGILLRAGSDVAKVVAERIVAAAQKDAPDAEAQQKSSAMMAINVGVATYPQDGEKAAALVDAVRGALNDAVSSGPYAIGEANADSTGESVGNVSVDRPRATPENPLAAVPAGSQAMLDSNTGFLQYSHLDKVLQKKIAQYRREETPVSLVLFEIDHIDRYRDYYGDEGIVAIQRQVGSHLQNTLREGDLLSRFENDQYLLILGCTHENGLKTARRLADQIKAMEIHHDSAQLTVTFTAGIASYPDHGRAARKLVEYAEIALDVAKANGQDRCVGYELGLELPREDFAARQSY